MKVTSRVSANALIACATLFLVHTIEAHASAPSTEEPPSGAQEAAEQGKETLKAIVIKLLDGKGKDGGTQQFLDEFGMKGIETPDDAQRLELGSPLPTYRISLKTLQALRTWRDLKTVLPEKANRFVYPIKTGKEIRSSLSVALSRKGMDWLVTEWSNGKLMRLIAGVQMQYPKAKSILWLPGLNRYFLVDEADFTIIIPLDLISPISPVPRAGMNLVELQTQANEVVALREQTRLPPGHEGPDRPIR